MERQGIKEGKRDSMHDDPIITLNMFIDDPNSVRYDERVKAGKATINGVDLSNRAKATELAKKIVEFRARHTVDAINKAIANKGTLPRRRGPSAAGTVDRFRLSAFGCQHRWPEAGSKPRSKGARRAWAFSPAGAKS